MAQYPINFQSCLDAMKTLEGQNCEIIAVIALLSKSYTQSQTSRGQLPERDFGDRLMYFILDILHTAPDNVEH